MELNQQAKEFLSETAKWATFLSIFGFIAIAILVIFAFGMGTFLSGLSNNNLGISPQFISIIYLLLAGIYFIPVFFLFQFGTKTGSAIKNNDTDLLIFGLKKLKSHYKFIGIFTILATSFYILLLIFTIFTALLN